MTTGQGGTSSRDAGSTEAGQREDTCPGRGSGVDEAGWEAGGGMREVRRGKNELRREGGEVQQW